MNIILYSSTDHQLRKLKRQPTSWKHCIFLLLTDKHDDKISGCAFLGFAFWPFFGLRWLLGGSLFALISLVFALDICSALPEHEMFRWILFFNFPLFQGWIFKKQQWRILQQMLKKSLMLKKSFKTRYFWCQGKQCNQRWSQCLDNRKCLALQIWI